MQQTILIKDAQGNTQTVFPNNPNGANVSINSAPVVLSSDTAQANLSLLASVLQYQINGAASISVYLTGGTGFVLQPQASLDGTNWVNVGMVQFGLNSTSTPVLTLTTGGTYEFNPLGYAYFRLVNTTVSTGTLTATLVSSSMPKFAKVTAIGDQNDTASWYSNSTSAISLLKMLVAVLTRSGSHVYTYASGNLATDQWTFLGTTRTKTYTYIGSVMQTESDWV